MKRKIMEVVNRTLELKLWYIGFKFELKTPYSYPVYIFASPPVQRSPFINDLPDLT